MRSPKPKAPHAVRVPPSALIKVFLLASVSVIASVWALVRFYTHPHVPMVVPVPTVVAVDAGGEIPAPEVEIVR